MVEKDILGNPLTHDIFGNPIKQKNKREPIKKSQKNLVFDNQKGKCYFCKKRLNLSSTHFDHIKEVARGGRSTTSNLRAVCANYHLERHNRDKAMKADKGRAREKKKGATWYNPITSKEEKLTSF